MSVEPREIDKETGAPVSRFDRFTLLGLEVCAMAFVVFMAYSSYGLYVGGGGHVEEARLVRNLGIALNLMMGSLFGFVFFCVVRYFEESATGYFLLIGGGVLALVAPAITRLVLGSGLGEQGAAQALASTRFRAMSMAMLLPGAVLVITDAIRRGRRGMQERKKVTKRKRERAPELEKPRIIPMGKCYQTPYCREWIRAKCPVYYSKKTCWRHRVGCYCDEKVIIAALGKEADTRMFNIRYSRSFMTAQSYAIRGTKAGKERCRNCFLYQFHQKEKYQILSPLVFVVVGVLVWKGIPAFHKVFFHIVDIVEGFFSEATFATPTGPGTSAAAWMNQQGSFNVFFWFVAILCSVLLLSYMLQLIEYVVFKLQW
jgi:hypothetical protein